MSGMARIQGCKVLPLPMKYLGLPLDAPFKAKFICKIVIKKMERRLVAWKDFNCQRVVEYH
jgi:hypothetical protein